MKKKVIHLTMILIICMVSLFSNMPLFSQTVTLAWSPSTNPDIDSYGIYRSVNSDSDFVLLSTIAHPDTIFTDNNVEWDIHYYYAATSIDQYGNESGFSNSIDTLMHAATPVELSYFSCHLRDNIVILEWTTTSELNNFGFEIQRSRDREHGFNKIGFVNGKGTTSDENNYEFMDDNAKSGTFYYRMKQIDFSGVFKFSKTIEITVNIPNKFCLDQNYPNPFNSTTSISYSIPTSGNVQLIIYNTNGKEVFKAVDKFQQAGRYSFHWNGLSNAGENLASGVYYYTIWTNNFTSYRKMTLLK